VPQKEHERVSETGVFPSLNRVSGTLCLSHYVTEVSHLHSLGDFWRHFGLCRAAAHSGCCFFAPCTNILAYLLTCLLQQLRRSKRTTASPSKRYSRQCKAAKEDSDPKTTGKVIWSKKCGQRALVQLEKNRCGSTRQSCRDGIKRCVAYTQLGATSH